MTDVYELSVSYGTKFAKSGKPILRARFTEDRIQIRFQESFLSWTEESLLMPEMISLREEKYPMFIMGYFVVFGCIEDLIFFKLSINE